jgi:hypothetical protein
LTVSTKALPLSEMAENSRSRSIEPYHDRLPFQMVMEAIAMISKRGGSNARRSATLL